MTRSLPKMTTDFFAGLDDDLDQAVMKIDAKQTAFAADGQLASAADAMAFMTAGNATFTLRSKKTGVRFTFKIALPHDKETGKVDRNATLQFVSLLNGADNQKSYVYIGYIKRGVYYHGNAKARVGRDAPSNRAFEWAWRQLTQNQMPDSLEVWHEGCCGRCGRKLTVPSSVRSGFGPECSERVGL